MTNQHFTEKSSRYEKITGESKSGNGMTFYMYCFIILLYLFPTLLIGIGLEIFDDPPERSIKLESPGMTSEPAKAAPEEPQKEVLSDEPKSPDALTDSLAAPSEEPVTGDEKRETSGSRSENKDERGWYLPFGKISEKNRTVKENIIPGH